MNYYIDFDNTLYNTPVLSQRMLETIAKVISKKSKSNERELFEEAKALFNRENIYDIYKLVKYFEKKYNVENSDLSQKITNVILNSNDLVFEDVVPFLTKLKEQGHKLYMLTFCTDSLEMQSLKIAGSKIADYFDTLYITKEQKYALDINYENGIFIDDNPIDLLGLYGKRAKKVIRIIRPKNKYSVKDIENENIIEYEGFKNLLKSIDKYEKKM